MTEKYGFDEVTGVVNLPTYSSDVVEALRGLCKDMGITTLTIRYTGDPTTLADSPAWNCEVILSGRSVLIENRHSPSEAALAMAEALLREAVCALCNRRVALMPGPHLPEPYCAWKLIGAEWTPGCSIETLISAVTDKVRGADSSTEVDAEFEKIISTWEDGERGAK